MPKNTFRKRQSQDVNPVYVRPPPQVFIIPQAQWEDPSSAPAGRKTQKTLDTEAKLLHTDKVRSLWGEPSAQILALALNWLYDCQQIITLPYKGAKERTLKPNDFPSYVTEGL